MSNAIERTCVVPHHAARRLCVIRITPVIGATGIHLLKILLIKSRRNPTPTGIFFDKTPLKKERWDDWWYMYSNSSFFFHILPSTNTIQFWPLFPIIEVRSTEKWREGGAYRAMLPMTKPHWRLSRQGAGSTEPLEIRRKSRWNCWHPKISTQMKHSHTLRFWFGNT